MTEEYPEPRTYPSPKDWTRGVAETRARMMEERKRAFPPGSTRKCPYCGKRRLHSSDDLTREAIVGSVVIMHHNLHGARCASCGVEYLESYEELALEDAGPERILSDYRAKVTAVSGRNLGTYWPKDVVRVLDLHKDDALDVQVLGPDSMLIRRRHLHDEEATAEG